MPDETTPNPSQSEAPAPSDAAKAPKAKPVADPEAKAAKPKKEKPPALEDKPFAEFITQDYFPALKKTLETMGIADASLSLEKQVLPVRGMENAGECSQVIGRFGRSDRMFMIGFLKDDIASQKVFAYSEGGTLPSTLESFMIDERKVTLDLLLLYTIQRLNGQKWLVRN